MVIMHEAVRKFLYNIFPEAIQEFKKIMQKQLLRITSRWTHASKILLCQCERTKTLLDNVEMDSCIEDPFVPMRTYQDIVAEMCRSI